MKEIDGFLPDRKVDLHALARQIMREHDLPEKIYAVRRTKFPVQEVVSMLLAYHNESQTRTGGGEWRYTHDPLTVDMTQVMLAIKDAARIRLGCESWGCRTAADLDDIVFEDSLGNDLGEWMKQKEAGL